MRFLPHIDRLRGFQYGRIFSAFSVLGMCSGFAPATDCIASECEACLKEIDAISTSQLQAAVVRTVSSAEV